MTSRKRSRKDSVSSSRSLLFVAPTRRELCGLTSKHPLFRTGIVGLGDSAGYELSSLVREKQPDLVVSIGFAGALHPDFDTGDVILCDSVALSMGSDDPTLALDPNLRQLINSLLTKNGLVIRSGGLISVSYPLIHATDKRTQGIQTGGVAVEMEGYSLVKAANHENVPLVMLRVILDPMSRELPRLVTRIIKDHGRNEWRHALHELVCDPRLIVTLIRLARDSRVAVRSLSAHARAIKHAFLGDN